MLLTSRSQSVAGRSLIIPTIPGIDYSKQEFRDRTQKPQRIAERGRVRTSDALFSAYRLLQTGALDHSATSPKTIPISPLSSRLRAYTDQRPPINVKNRMRSGIVSEDSHTSFGENCNQ